MDELTTFVDFCSFSKTWIKFDPSEALIQQNKMIISDLV
jgi:hypothetical protein